MTVSEYIVTAPDEIRAFLEQTDQDLLENGYHCEIKEAKNGPLVSYLKDKRTLLNYVCRKSGIKVRLYAAHVGQYENLLDNLPDTMKAEIVKATDCKKLNGLPCSPTCPGGYLFHMDGAEYRKCRSMAFLHSLNGKTVQAVSELIDQEVGARG